MSLQSREICRRTGFAGEPAAGTCPDCGHMIMAHVGAESCVACRMEWLISPTGQAHQARVQGRSPL